MPPFTKTKASEVDHKCTYLKRSRQQRFLFVKMLVKILESGTV